MGQIMDEVVERYDNGVLVIQVRRELAQCRALLDNQRDYIKTLQEENLRLNKELSRYKNVPTHPVVMRDKTIAKQEALIAELVEVMRDSAEMIRRADFTPARSRLLVALEKGNGK